MVSMQLRTYYFFESSASDTRKQGLLRAYHAALQFITKLADEDVKNDFVKYAPLVFCQMLPTAGMLVMKIINSSYSRYVDIDRGKRSFNTVLSLLRKATVEDNDTQGRGGKILAQLWTVHHSQTVLKRQQQNPNLRVKSRLATSVLHDGLWEWREEFGGQRGFHSGPSNQYLDTAPLSLSDPPGKFATHFPQTWFPRSYADKSATPATDSPKVGESEGDVQQQQILRPSTSAISNARDMNDLASELTNCDWIWDVGFSSLLPIDLDADLSPPTI
jgi:hypothetical protein